MNILIVLIVFRVTFSSDPLCSKRVDALPDGSSSNICVFRPRPESADSYDTLDSGPSGSGPIICLWSCVCPENEPCSLDVVFELVKSKEGSWILIEGYDCGKQDYDSHARYTMSPLEISVENGFINATDSSPDHLDDWHGVIFHGLEVISGRAMIDLDYSDGALLPDTEGYIVVKNSGWWFGFDDEYGGRGSMTFNIICSGMNCVQSLQTTGSIPVFKVKGDSADFVFWVESLNIEFCVWSLEYSWGVMGSQDYYNNWNAPLLGNDPIVVFDLEGEFSMLKFEDVSIFRPPRLDLTYAGVRLDLTGAIHQTIESKLCHFDTVMAHLNLWDSVSDENDVYMHDSFRHSFINMRFFNVGAYAFKLVNGSNILLDSLYVKPWSGNYDLDFPLGPDGHKRAYPAIWFQPRLRQGIENVIVQNSVFLLAAKQSGQPDPGSQDVIQFSAGNSTENYILARILIQHNTFTCEYQTVPQPNYRRRENKLRVLKFGLGELGPSVLDFAEIESFFFQQNIVASECYTYLYQNEDQNIPILLDSSFDNNVCALSLWLDNDKWRPDGPCFVQGDSPLEKQQTMAPFGGDYPSFEIPEHPQAKAKDSLGSGKGATYQQYSVRYFKLDPDVRRERLLGDNNFANDFRIKDFIVMAKAPQWPLDRGVGFSWEPKCDYYGLVRKHADSALYGGRARSTIGHTEGMGKLYPFPKYGYFLTGFCSGMWGLIVLVVFIGLVLVIELSLLGFQIKKKLPHCLLKWIYAESSKKPVHQTSFVCGRIFGIFFLGYVIFALLCDVCVLPFIITRFPERIGGLSLQTRSFASTVLILTAFEFCLLLLWLVFGTVARFTCCKQWPSMCCRKRGPIVKNQNTRSCLRGCDVFFMVFLHVVLFLVAMVNWSFALVFFYTLTFYFNLSIESISKMLLRETVGFLFQMFQIGSTKIGEVMLFQLF